MDTEPLYQYHLECRSFDCKYSPEGVITVVEGKDIQEIRDMNPRCEKCGFGLTNSRLGFAGSQLPVIQIR